MGGLVPHFALGPKPLNSGVTTTVEAMDAAIGPIASGGLVHSAPRTWTMWPINVQFPLMQGTHYPWWHISYILWLAKFHAQFYQTSSSSWQSCLNMNKHKYLLSNLFHLLACLCTYEIKMVTSTDMILVIISGLMAIRLDQHACPNICISA